MVKKKNPVKRALLYPAYCFDRDYPDTFDLDGIFFFEAGQ